MAVKITNTSIQTDESDPVNEATVPNKIAIAIAPWVGLAVGVRSWASHPNTRRKKTAKGPSMRAPPIKPYSHNDSRKKLWGYQPSVFLPKAWGNV